MWWNQANELEVGQIQVLFFPLIVYFICKATFYNRPHWNWSIGSKDTGSWRVEKTGNNKLSVSFGSILKSLFASSDSFFLITSYMKRTKQSILIARQGRQWQKMQYHIFIQLYICTHASISAHPEMLPIQKLENAKGCSLLLELWLKN